MTPITNPTALADQVSAASREADQANRRMQAGGAQLTYLPEPTPWLTTQLAKLFAAIDDGTARGCQHLEGGPRVVLAAAWAPNTVVCASCSPLLTPDEIEETTCDKCRTKAELIYPRSVTAGPLVYAYGLCEACADAEPDGHHVARSHRRTRR